jgi:hypothetical protein
MGDRLRNSSNQTQRQRHTSVRKVDVRSFLPERNSQFLTPILSHANFSIQSRYGPDYFDYGRKTSEFGMLKFDIDAGRVVFWLLMVYKQ